MSSIRTINYEYFRTVWSEEAAQQLAVCHDPAADWKDKLIAVLWLLDKQVPLNGAAPSMNFKGLPL